MDAKLGTIICEKNTYDKNYAIITKSIVIFVSTNMAHHYVIRK